MGCSKRGRKTMFWIEFGVLLLAIYVGIRVGGIGLGLIGGTGVTVFTFAFGMKPASPPIDVMLIILAVVAASATLHAAGGLTYMVQVAEKVLRKHPKYIVFLAPFCTYILTMAVGTGHAVYMLQPIIADVAYKTGIRPERPMAVSSIASQMGITASPIAAAVTSFLSMALKAGHNITLLNILERPTRPRVLWGESPLSSLARFRRLAYPGDGEATSREVLGCKSHGCPVLMSRLR